MFHYHVFKIIQQAYHWEITRAVLGLGDAYGTFELRRLVRSQMPPFRPTTAADASGMVRNHPWRSFAAQVAQLPSQQLEPLVLGRAQLERDVERDASRASRL